jgi:hypothetical protein
MIFISVMSKQISSEGGRHPNQLVRHFNLAFEAHRTINHLYRIDSMFNLHRRRFLSFAITFSPSDLNDYHRAKTKEEAQK